MPPSYDKSMGAGKKVAIGCGGLLVLILLALFLGFRWVKKNFDISTDPEVVLAMAEEVIAVDIPDGFEPIFSTYTRKGRLDPLSIFMAQASRTQETTMVLYERTGAYSQEEMFAEISNTGGGMKIDAGVESVGEDESFPIQYEGKEYQALLKEGLDEDQQMKRVLLTVIPQGDRTLLILFAGDPSIVRRDLIQEVLDSDLKADHLMPTPPTDAGKTSETNQ